jgi:cytochrome c-type biogenesis protein CcmF
MIPLVLLMGVGMHTAWRTQAAEPLLRGLRIPAALALAIGGLIPGLVYGRFGLLVTIGSVAAIWIAATAVLPAVRSIRRKPGTPAMSRAMLGMSVAHLGVAFFVFGVTITSAFSIETDHRMVPGEPVEVAGFDFELRNLRNVKGPNFDAIQGEIDISKDGEFIAQLRPQERTYRVQTSPMTEAGILATWNRDLFVALGEPLGEEAWSVRLQYKPMIRFIWLGCLIMAFGGIVAASDRRYRLTAKAKNPESVIVTEGGAA